MACSLLLYWDNYLFLPYSESLGSSFVRVYIFVPREKIGCNINVIDREAFRNAFHSLDPYKLLYARGNRLHG